MRFFFVTKCAAAAAAVRNVVTRHFCQVLSLYRNVRSTLTINYYKDYFVFSFRAIWILSLFEPLERPNARSAFLQKRRKMPE